MSDRGDRHGEAGRDSGSPTDFGKMWQDRRARTRAYREAAQAARARAAGKSREEVREIYLAELNARGLPRQSDAVLDAAVDSISGNPLPAVRIAAENLGQMGKELHKVFRTIRTGG